MKQQNALREIGAFAAVAALSFAFVRETPSPSLLLAVAFAGFLTAVIWLFTTEDTGRALLVLVLYLGLADGYLKLRVNHSYATLGRDVLLYAIFFGLIARKIIRRMAFPRLPPLTGWIVALAALCVVEIANPHSHGLTHSLAALRPHLEFVPLFFLGFMELRSARRIRIFCMLLLVVAVANGIVSFVQFNLTPAQLSKWGPGYSARINGSIGSGAVAPRTYAVNGVAKVRPFGLGSDSGAGGVFGILAIPAGIALVSLRRRRLGSILVSTFGVAGAVLAIVTSEGRSVVVGGIVVLFAYIGLTVVSRRLLPTLAAVALAGLVGFLTISTLSAHSGQGSAFTRYSTIAPNKLLSTASEARGSSLTLTPQIAKTYPFGAGLGSVGPAARQVGGVAAVRATPALNAENEFNFLIDELGLAGLAIVVGFTVHVLLLTSRIRRIADPDLRLLLAATAAPMVGVFILYFGSAPTATSPTAPYLWFIGGALVFWLARPGRAVDHQTFGPAVSLYASPLMPVQSAVKLTRDSTSIRDTAGEVLEAADSSRATGVPEASAGARLRWDRPKPVYGTATDRDDTIGSEAVLSDRARSHAARAAVLAAAVVAGVRSYTRRRAHRR